MSKRYIEADTAVSNADARYGEWVLAMAAAEGSQVNMVYKKQELFKAVKKVIESCPSVDPDSLRPVAHWDMEEDAVGDPIVWTCSNCKDSIIMYDGTPMENGYKYCPYCGARMEDATDGDFNVKIHCENEQEMDEAVALLNLANRMHWRKTAENPPKAEDADPRSATVLTVQVGIGFVTAWEWHIVADFPEEFPLWMPMPELPEEKRS